MSAITARAYLDHHKPPYIDSAADFGGRFRIANRTAIETLREAGYIYENTPAGQRWVYHESQLDRIERKLDKVLAFINALHAANTPNAAA